jgi:hypothetical protein
MKLFVTICFVLLINIVKSQSTFTYAYSDPCTGVLKTIDVPKDGVTITYYGQINTFSQSQIQNGDFQYWAQNIYSSYGGSNPCASIIGLSSVLNIAQDIAINSINILNSLSAAADLQAEMQGMTDIMAATGSANTASNKKDKKNDQNNNSSSQSSTEGNKTSEQPTSNTGSTSSTENGSTTEGGNSTSTNQSTEGGNQSSESSVAGNSSSNSTGSNTNEKSDGGGETEEKSPDTKADGTEEKKSSNVVEGAVTSIQKSTEKNGPTTILSSDFTGFNFKKNDMTYGGKVTGGFTSMRWDGRRTHGFLLDYTSAMKGPNATAFYAFIRKKRIDLISGTATASFYGKGSLYGTLALGQLWTIRKNVKVIYLATTSWGTVYQEKFTGTAFIAGGMYDWKASKKIDIKFTGLFIYAPFISYYNDLVLKSPYVVMPLIGTNVKLTKKFKLSVNMGGTYAIGQNVMNFTIMCGTRFAI